MADADASARTGLRPGALFGRYVLIESVGVGSMGEVWAAIDPELDRKVALKLLRNPRPGHVHEHERLLREARAMARLNHPNVVAVHDVGEVEGRIFVAMEFVAGESLAEWIAAGPHAWSEVLEIMRQAGEGLAAAHHVGLIHRDFKPANVLIGRDGRVRVVDFGLAATHPRVPPRALVPGERRRKAKPIEFEPAKQGKDQRGKVLRVRPPQPEDESDETPAAVGTPAYMAAEQHRGESFDERSDLFAYCVTLFEALYGRRPFAGDHRFAVALAIVEGRLSDVPPAARAPEWIHAAVLRGLATDPAQRWPDMDTLLRVLANDPVARRRRWLGLAAVGVGVVALIGLARALQPPPRDPCADAGTAMGVTWTAQRRGKLGNWLDADTRALVLERLDEHADQWIAADRALCHDRVARRTTARLADERRRCLDRQLDALEAVLELPGRGEPLAGLRRAQPARVHARPHALLRTLGQPESCRQVSETSDHADPALDRALARADVFLALELTDAAELELNAGPACRGADSCPPTLALARGRLAALRGERVEAEALLHRAAAGLVHSAPSKALQAWTELARLGGEDASTWIAYADALVPIDQPAPELSLVAAELEHEANQPVRARARIEAALGAATGPGRAKLDPDVRARLLLLRAQLHREAGELEAARADESEAQALIRR